MKPPRDGISASKRISEAPVLIQGPGAIGRLLAMRLSSAGVHVELLSRGMRGQRRLALFEGDGPGLRAQEFADLRFHSLEDEADPRFGLLVVTTKAYDVAAAISAGAKYLLPGAPILVLSNGLGHDESLLEFGGDQPKLLGTIACGAIAETHGRIGREELVVRTFGEGPIRLGPPVCNASPAISQSVGMLLSRGGFEIHCVEDGRQAQWEKAALNCGLNPVASLLGEPNGQIPKSAYFLWAIEAARETAQIGRASGLRLPERGWRGRLADLCARTAQNQCSMLQDLLAGRRLEIDHLNGWVARRGARLAVPTPRNQSLANLLANKRSQELLRWQQTFRQSTGLELTRVSSSG